MEFSKRPAVAGVPWSIVGTMMDGRKGQLKCVGNVPSQPTAAGSILLPENRRGIIIHPYLELLQAPERGRSLHMEGQGLVLGYLGSSVRTVRGLGKWPLASVAQECLGHLTTHNAPCVSPWPREWTSMQRQSFLSMPVQLGAQRHGDWPRMISCTRRPCIA